MIIIKFEILENFASCTLGTHEYVQSAWVSAGGVIRVTSHPLLATQ